MMRKVLSMLLTLILLFTTNTAIYAQNIDTSQTGSLTLLFKEPVDAEISISQVATYDAFGDYTYTGHYNNNKVTLNNLHNEKTLNFLVALNKNAPNKVKKTVANNKIVFDNLSPGIYLIVQENKITAKKEMLPFLAPIPESLNGDYDVLAKPKIDTPTTPPITDPDIDDPTKPDPDKPDTNPNDPSKPGAGGDTNKPNGNGGTTGGQGTTGGGQSATTGGSIGSQNNPLANTPLENTPLADSPVAEQIAPLIQTGMYKLVIVALVAGGAALIGLGKHLKKKNKKGDN